jgi:AraC-like DNA-binding protein
MYSREVNLALSHIEAHYEDEEQVSLMRLASVAACTPKFLARAFRRETGETVHRRVVRVRFARAAADVRAGGKIESVMLAVGYRSKPHFYRQFKEWFGATPAAYRRIDPVSVMNDRDDVRGLGGP